MIPTYHINQLVIGPDVALDMGQQSLFEYMADPLPASLDISYLHILRDLLLAGGTVTEQVPGHVTISAGGYSLISYGVWQATGSPPVFTLFDLSAFDYLDPAENRIVSARFDPSLHGFEELLNAVIADPSSADSLVADFIAMEAENGGIAGYQISARGASDDVLNGTLYSDWIFGGGGDDRLRGLHGLDELAGGSGSDTLSGGAGKDRLFGGAGHDVLIGGPGADVFEFEVVHAGADTIRDFQHLVDKIQFYHGWFTGLDANQPLGTKFFASVNVDANGAKFGYQHVLYDTDSGKLYYDPDGSGPLARTLIAIVRDDTDAPAHLTAGDFVVY